MKYLVLGVLSCVLFSCNGNDAISKRDLPNVIYINVDDMGWMDTATYGSSYYETPNITKLANAGMVFTNGYAGAANCAPSRACFMSGQNTPRHGMYTVGNSERGNSKTRKLIPTPNTTILADSVFTLAELFKSAGYVTGTFGKWHLGKDPRTQGFDLNIGGDQRGNPGRNGYFSPYNIQNIEKQAEGENLTDRLTKEAIQFVRDNKDQPFFLYLPYYAVHTPLETFPELIKKYKTKGGNEYQQNATYAGMIETVDTNIGLLMDTLESLELDNTLIIFTSDNGGIRAVSSQYPLRAGKGSYYEGGIRVPYIMQWKGVIKANSISETPITNLDFFPTFMTILDKEVADKVLDGVNILPILQGEAIADRALYFHFPIYLESYRGVLDDARDPLFRTRPGSVIIDGKWKLHHYFEDNALELYDLETDLGERMNLTAINPKRTNAMLQKLNNWRLATNATIPAALNPEFEADDSK